MLITSLLPIDLLLVVLTISLLLYKYATRNFDHWKRKGVYYIEPIPILGNAYDLSTFKMNMGVWFRSLYDKINQPYFGLFIFDKPYLVVKSPELIKHILVKDFNHFMDRTILAPEHDKVFANIMFSQKSPGWRTVRAKMTPAFTSGKLKGMFNLVNNVGLDMNKYIKNNLGSFEAKEICAKYSTDVIAICAFAIKAHCFEDEDADFRKVGRTMFDFTWRNGINQTAFFFLQGWAKFLRLNFFDSWTVKYLNSVFWETIRMREEANIKGNDLIDIIIKMRKDKELCKEMDFEGEKVVAQAVQFYLAGFETTSSTIAFTLYELCVHPEMQDKLRNEIIDNIKENQGITYEGVLNMKYLDMCIKETLRMYPVLPFLDRRCNADYKLPGTDVVIEKGTPVFIPMMGVHYDEQYFPEPYKYNPERFQDKNSYNLNGLSYIPFGDGPRVCLGERFGLLTTKLGLVHIVSEFILERTQDTPVPIKFEPKSFLLQSTVGLPMKFKEFLPRPA